jgi:D-citramalate synthase
LGDKKKKLTPADLPVIISDVMRTGTSKVAAFTDYEIITRRGKLPMAKVEMLYRGKTLAATASGDGGYDAFMKAVRKMLKQEGLKAPRLVGYEVHIPPGGKTDAIVETTISWDNGKDPVYSTIGVDSDQTEAAIQATEKMLNLEASK